ncbi:phospholipid/cholesterol/gamma-HCH transport system permease protein [Flavobacterium swingsii]|jgi:phospholipid/cholesterol/gamma-HCH transport system permease protein|uniref:Phospholipid/cholesterol/gamma-HCH transport system permease protein n=1 Tax=Flavobacterium swingsii TaxID=498292 RepID=A0A1I0WV10_9FLAO|nr:ABC transporter permease [Flavobacterium swingsii]SFA92612.1 phospholipid/cholesterol/gamma-HCH transport system permease protein [Flavobacterium swingsii]
MKIYLRKTFIEVGSITLFASRFFKEIFRPDFEVKEFIRQCRVIGYKSLPLVSITAFIMGLVLTIQSRPAMAKFGAESWIPGMVSLSLIREIAPVITALICAGKISSGIGAELGSMKVTEQIDAMEVSAINPYRYLVVTRILATTLMVPILVFYADLIGIYGGYIGVNMHGEVNLTRYFSQVFESLEFVDVIPATLKTFFFGFFIGMIGCHKGFNATSGTEGVGKAANSAVVSASLAIFIIDMIAVQLTDLFF